MDGTIEAFALFHLQRRRSCKMLGLDEFFPIAASRQLGTDKLFLDGLVSVWQVDGR